MRVQSSGQEDPLLGGHGNPSQYSCLGNSMDREAWQATVHRVAQSQIRLKWLSTNTWVTRRKDKGSVGDGALLGEMVLKWERGQLPWSEEGWGLQEEGKQQSHWAVKSQARVGNRDYGWAPWRSLEGADQWGQEMNSTDLNYRLQEMPQDGGGAWMG